MFPGEAPAPLLPACLPSMAHRFGLGVSPLGIPQICPSFNLDKWGAESGVVGPTLGMPAGGGSEAGRGVHPQKEGAGAAPRWFQPRDHVSSPTDWGEGPAFLCDHVPNPSKGLPMGMWVLDAGTDLQALCQ